MGYSAVFIGTGAGLPKFMGIPGESLNGVYSANEFLTRINLMQAFQFPQAETPMKVGERVAVIGSGNTAMDAVRSAMRLGAEQAMVVYRRSENEMTARIEEYQHAIEEGVEFHWLTNPIEVLGEDGWVTGLKCLRMELGEPDDSGRARPVPIEGSEFIFPVDNVVLSIGTRPNPLLAKATPGLKTHSWGGLLVDERKVETSRAPSLRGRRRRDRRSHRDPGSRRRQKRRRGHPRRPNRRQSLTAQCGVCRAVGAPEGINEPCCGSGPCPRMAGRPHGGLLQKTAKCESLSSQTVLQR